MKYSLSIDHISHSNGTKLNKVSSTTNNYLADAQTGRGGGIHRSVTLPSNFQTTVASHSPLLTVKTMIIKDTTNNATF